MGPTKGRVMAFLSVITRTYRRPKALATCIASLEAQDDKDYEQIFLVDDVGVGIAETYRMMAARSWEDVNGDYVYLLDDDNLLADPSALSKIKEAAKDWPDMIIARADMGANGILPPRNGGPLVVGMIDLGCVVLHRDLFFEAAKSFGARYEGDYDYIVAAFKTARSIYWLNEIIMRAQRISSGEPEW